MRALGLGLRNRRWALPSRVGGEVRRWVVWACDLMAEIIQERIEDRLPELEQLERIGLFSHAEIK